MILTEEQKKGQEVFFRIIIEAWLDENFKQKLIENPEKTLEAFFGKSTQLTRKIKVFDQSNPEYLYINIPVKPQNEDFKKFKNLLKNRSTLNDYDNLYESLKETSKQ